MSKSKESKEPREIKEIVPPTCAGGIIDSHAHVVAEYFEDAEVVMARARALGITMVNPAVNLKSIAELNEITARYDYVYAAAGLHPHEAKDWDETSADMIRQALSNKKFVAVGECGLDFYYNNSERDHQLKAFSKQIALAVELDKPVIVHCRDAWEDTFNLLKVHQGKVRGVFHCFTGGPEHLAAISELDFYVSFSGILTYSSAKSIQAAAPIVAENRILVETDCPFLSPQKVRGKRNEPAHVWFTAEKLAQLRGASLDAISAQVSENARDLFRLS